MKKLLYAITIPLLAIITCVILMIIPSGENGSVVLIIRPGESGHSVFQKIKKNDLLSSEVLYKLSLKCNVFCSGPIQPGIYDIKTPVSCWSLTSRLTKGERATLTIPEGLTQREIAALIEKRLKLKNSSYLAELKKGRPRYEGRLFPATYPLVSENPERLITMMLETFKKKTAKLAPTKNDIILASIIQKEGARVEEFKRISGVFHNRLDEGMKLESDPTLQYIVGKIRLTKKVLRSRSPYNSYRCRGLPPGPICNPGLAAIEAAMSPEDHDFFYFVSMKNGYHYFSETKWEHFRAVGHYQLGLDNGFEPRSGNKK